MAKMRPETEVRKAMQSLGVYKEEFDPMIEIFCELRAQYDLLTKKFRDGGYRYAEYTASGTKKAPIVATLEGLRKDILSYGAQLGITPHGLAKLNEQALAAKKPANALAQALKELSLD